MNPKFVSWVLSCSLALHSHHLRWLIWQFRNKQCYSVSKRLGSQHFAKETFFLAHVKFIMHFTIRVCRKYLQLWRMQFTIATMLWRYKNFILWNGLKFHVMKTPGFEHWLGSGKDTTSVSCSIVINFDNAVNFWT